MSDSSSDLGAFFAGFVVGGLVGAAAALLMAPQSGLETRAQIKQKSIELRDQATDSLEEARHRAEELATQARTRAEELQQRGKVILEEQKGRIEAVVDAARKAPPKKDVPPTPAG